MDEPRPHPAKWNKPDMNNKKYCVMSRVESENEELSMQKENTHKVTRGVRRTDMGLRLSQEGLPETSRL